MQEQGFFYKINSGGQIESSKIEGAKLKSAVESSRAANQVPLSNFSNTIKAIVLLALVSSQLAMYLDGFVQLL